MAKRKTGIGVQALFEKPKLAQPEGKPEVQPAEAATKPFELKLETIERLEAAQDFIGWLVGQKVSQETVVEVALNIALEELEAQGKESRLITEVLKQVEGEVSPSPQPRNA